MEHTWDEYMISTDKARLDIAAIHKFLTASYWSQGIPIETVRRSIQGSLCFGLYKSSEQIGFARVITDGATFGYLCDVYVLDSYRGIGLSKRLMQAVVEHPSLQGLRRFSLATRDAHSLYSKFGFASLQRPERYMEILNPKIYKVPQLNQETEDKEIQALQSELKSESSQ